MKSATRIGAALCALLLTASLAAPGSAGRRGGARWGADYFPNVPLTTHEGEELRFFDDVIKDKVVALNFIYTSCPDVCPLETARMANVQRILGDRVGKDVFLYSISIDPENDTLEVLADYAKRYKAGPGWVFLRGTEADVTLLQKKLGLIAEELEDLSEHNLSMVIGNQRTGQWMKRSPFENAHFLAEQIGGWLHNWRKPSLVANNYANAPKLRNPSAGETVFRTRCAACHTIGGGDLVGTDPLHLGPDLLGVTEKRERRWLQRWIFEPDAMLAEGDPIATDLLDRFGGIAMPNTGLSGGEVNSVIEFLASENERLAERRTAKAPMNDGGLGDHEGHGVDHGAGHPPHH